MAEYKKGLHVGIIKEKILTFDNRNKEILYTCNTNVGTFIAVYYVSEKILKINPPRNSKDLTTLDRFRYDKRINKWTTVIEFYENVREVLTELIRLFYYRNSSNQLELF